MSIITLTVNPTLDKSAVVAQVAPDHKLSCNHIKFHPGGGGVNVSRVINRLGGNATTIFQSSGPSGKLLKKLLINEAIQIVPYKTLAYTRENFIVTDASTKKQYRFGMPGPAYSNKEINECFNLVQKTAIEADFLVLSGSLSPGMPENFFAKICKWAKSQNIKVMLDSSGPAVTQAIEEGVFLVKPNLKELSEIAGTDFISKEEQEAIARSIIDRKKANIVVVSLGARGAMMVSEKGVVNICPPTVVVKSTVGAGDSMVAGIVWALSQNFSHKDVLQYGIACGTAATMNSGTELCLKEDVDYILTKLKT